MDVLQLELAKLHKDGNLTQSIQDVDKIIEQLERARGSIVAGKRCYFLQVRRSGGGWAIGQARRIVETILGATCTDPLLRPKLRSIYSRQDTKPHEERLRQSQR
jgi:hypothetical protein